MEPAPLRQTLRFHWVDIVKVSGAIFFATALTYLFIYLPTYLERIGVSRLQVLAANVVGLSILVVVCLVSAVLSERLGRKPFLVAAPLCTALLVLPAFLLLQRSFPELLLVHAVFGALIGLFGGAYPAAFSELFPTKVRYSALSLGYSVSVSVFGGSAPLIFAYFQESTGSPIAPAFYILGAALVSLVSTITIVETARKPLPNT